MNITQNDYLLTIKYGIGIKNSNGYFTTLANPLFKNLKGNIFIIGYDSGKIIQIFETKDEFIGKLAGRNKQNKLVLYFNKTIEFTEDELEKYSTMNIIAVDEAKKRSIVRNEMRRLSPPPSFIGDFVPGYVETFSNPLINMIKVNIIVSGFEDGLIYYLFDNKEDLFRELSNRKSRMKLNVYYKNIVFTKSELEYYWNANIWMTDQTTKDKISNSWNETMKLVYM